MTRRVLALFAFISATVGAYLVGQRSGTAARAPIAEATAPAITAVAIQPPLALPLENSPRLPFAEMYGALQTCTGSCRGDLVHALQKISKQRDRTAATAAVFKTLALLDVQAAIRLLTEVEDEQERLEALQALLQGAASITTPLLVEMLMKTPGEFGELARTKFLVGQLRFWSALDAPATAKFIDEHPALLDRIAATDLLTNWAGNDPQAAEAWLSRHPELGDRANVIDALVHGVFEYDPEMARNYVIANAVDERFESVRGVVALKSFLTSPQVAEQFIRALPEEARAGALIRIATVDFELLQANKTTGVKDYADLADWLLRFSPDERNGSLGALVSNWQEQDAIRPLQWLTELAPAKQEAAIAEYAGQLNSSGIRAVLACANLPLRSRILEEFLKRSEAGSAEEIANAYNLTPAEAQLFMQAAPNRSTAASTRVISR